MIKVLIYILSTTIEDIGDKFYIVLSGEVMIELPDPKIPKAEFFLRYNAFLEL